MQLHTPTFFFIIEYGVSPINRYKVMITRMQGSLNPVFRDQYQVKI